MFIDFMTLGKPFSIGYIRETRWYNEISNKNFCFNMTESKELTPFDRMALIRQNFNLISGLQVAYACFYPVKKMQSMYLSSWLMYLSLRT